MVQLFLSFSGEDNGSGLVRDFFTDLCTEIGNITALAPDGLGYNYLDMRTAMRWRKELSEALGSCKVFIPLYSPRYFASPFCGKEWWAFSRRQADHILGTADPEPEMIFPVLWEGVFDGRRPIPKAAADIWAKQPNLGDRYAERGLRQLVQLKHNKEYGPLYHEIIFALGKRLAELIDDSPLAADVMSDDFDSFGNAFCDPLTAQKDTAAAGAVATPDTDDGPSRERPASPRPVPGPRTSLSGPKHVRLVVASGTQEDLSGLREDTTPYGDRQHDWAPYTPDHPDPVLMYAVEVASELRLMPHLEEFDGEVAQLLDKVEADNELAVIILDPWTIELSGRQAALGEYDKRLTMNTGMAVPQNASDTETTANTDALRQQLLNVLGRHAQLREPVFKVSLKTVAAFQDALRQILVELTRQVMMQAPQARPALRSDPGVSFDSRPFLDGPSEG
ncbi:FxsC protein [Streptomyces globisporus]|uniref:FxsC protein n=1 Tax=Streptomyces globisporus TaxID=1908 RepID=UPI0036FB6C25